eukprot:403586-Rhodomonas_salina.1
MITSASNAAHSRRVRIPTHKQSSPFISQCNRGRIIYMKTCLLIDTGSPITGCSTSEFAGAS